MIESATPLLIARAVITDENRMLIVQRSQNDSYRSSEWEFPGGKVDANEVIAEGLAREIKEEVGLDIELAGGVAHVENEIIQKGKYTGRLYVALFYAARRLGGDVLISNEHDAFAWVTHEEAEEYNLTPESYNAHQSLRVSGILLR